MTRIGRIRLLLPATHGEHAREIATTIARRLAAELPRACSGVTEMQLPPLRLSAGKDPAEVAAAATEVILQEFRDRHDPER